jgi:hypothetical protein
MIVFRVSLMTQLAISACGGGARHVWRSPRAQAWASTAPGGYVLLPGSRGQRSSSSMISPRRITKSLTPELEDIQNRETWSRPAGTSDVDFMRSPMSRLMMSQQVSQAREAVHLSCRSPA